MVYSLKSILALFPMALTIYIISYNDFNGVNIPPLSSAGTALGGFILTLFFFPKKIEEEKKEILTTERDTQEEELSVVKDYCSAFADVLHDYTVKPEFKDLLELLEKNYPPTKPFIGKKVIFHFEKGDVKKINAKTKKKLNPIKYSSLEGYYCSFKLDSK